MAEAVPFKLKLTGDTADRHQFQGYDGYMALAGFAWTLALVTNYAETGKIRQRGDFIGRDSVRATVPRSGSIIADFTVLLQSDPTSSVGIAGVGAVTSLFLYDLTRRVISRNLGEESPAETDLLSRLVERRSGDVEALVAKVEPAIRQAHSVIGNGANNIQILGGHNIINTFTEETRDYVKMNVEDKNIGDKNFSIAAFNVNSGYGSVFDNDIGRTIPISMSKDILKSTSSIFTWGLDQYSNKMGGKVRVRYTRILAMDETPKRYVVLSAEKVPFRSR